MNSNKTISVWLVLEDGTNRRKVILQKRSIKNKTFPFMCQATWSGKVSPGEDVKNAVVRECREELGSSFCENIDFSKLEFIRKDDININKKNGSVITISAR